MNFNEIKDRIICRLVSRNKPEACPTDEAVQLEFMDLAVTFHIFLNEDEEAQTVTQMQIMKKDCEEWEIDTTVLYRCAIENMQRMYPPVLRNMEDVIHDILFLGCSNAELFGEGSENLLDDIGKLEGTGMFIYVLTNNRLFNGSTVLLYPQLLERIARQIGESTCMLPSSLHEVLLVPGGGDGGKSYEQIVKDVNQNCVDTGERLSDSVYVCSDILAELEKFKRLH